MAVVPYTFADQTGEIPLSELDANFANVKAFAETAGYVSGNAQANITSVGTLTSLTVAGNIAAPYFLGNVVGNISGNLVVAGANTQVLFNDSGIANATSGMTFNKATNGFVVSGNVTGGNLRTAGSITATGNILTSGIVSATGNVIGGELRSTGIIFSASSIFTNGVISSAGNVTASFLASSGGNIGVPTGVTTMRIGNITPTTIWIGGDASNIYLANVNSFTRVAGNLTVGADISANGSISAGNLISATGNIVTTANIAGGNLSITGTSTLTGTATAPTAANGTSNTQVATTAFVTNALINRIPSGVIVMWSGSIASIPTGWFLCDGGNSTPDLRDRFIVGAGNSYAVAATGGSKDAVVVTHTHTATSLVSDPGHTHSYTAPVSGIDDAGGFLPDVLSNTASTTGSSTTGIGVTTTVDGTGVSGTNANLPPYYALAYIMKA